MHMTPKAGRDDRGATLIELLVAIVILAVIVVPLGDALISFLRNTTSTTYRLSESHDAQIASAYFAQDVASLGVRNWSAAPYTLQTSVELNAPAAGGLYPCGPTGTPNAAIRFAGNDPTAAASTQIVVVSYVVRTVGTEQQLHRLRCTGGSTTPSSDVVLAHNIASVATPVTTGPADTPTTVSWTLTIKANGDTGAALVIVLFGQRRQT
jgi:prepilin-type N-terminal cleavage/methylation domain-containing protein